VSLHLEGLFIKLWFRYVGILPHLGDLGETEDSLSRSWSEVVWFVSGQTLLEIFADLSRSVPVRPSVAEFGRRAPRIHMYQVLYSNFLKDKSNYSE